MLRRLTGHRALAALALLALPACTAPSERVAEAPVRSDIAGQVASPATVQVTSPAGQPYLQVANVGGAAGATGFGPMAGSFALADGAIVYRHVAPVGPAVAGAPITDLRLSYFKVGPDGAVQDWATASVPASQSACPFYASGSFRHCTDFAAREQTFAALDPVVKTSAGAPLAAWGARRPDQLPATPAVASPTVAAPPPATSSLPLYPGANPDADAAYTN